MYTFFAFMPNAPLFGSISATALAPLQLGSLPYIINILMIIKFFFVVLLPPPFPKLYTHRLGRPRTRCAISGLLYSKKFPQMTQIEQPKCGSKIKNWGWLNCIYYHLPEHGAKIGPDEVSRPYGTSST